MYMRVVRVPGRLRQGIGLSDRPRLLALVALAIWVGAAAILALDLPMSILGRLSEPVLAAVMAQVLPSGLLLGAVLSGIAYVALLGEADGVGSVARHAAALSAIAAVVCRAIAVPVVVDSRAGQFAAAHSAAMALFALSSCAAAVGVVGIALAHAPATSVRRL